MAAPARPTRHPPRLPDGLAEAAPPALCDDAVWDSLVVTGPVSCADERPEHVEITGCHLRGVALTGWELDRLQLVDVVFDDCELSGVLLTEARFTRVVFNRCRMSGFVASGVDARDVAFTDCKLDAANLRMSSWERSEFVRCELPEADFTGARLQASSLLASNLTRVDFTKARLDDVALHGSILQEIHGADGLQGAVIGTDQVVPLAISLFAALRIAVDDDYA